MDSYLLLAGYFQKQLKVIYKLWKEIKNLDLNSEDKQYKFALQTQQLYTAIEDLFKHIASTFENEIEDRSVFHKELIMRMTLDVPNMRIAVIDDISSRLLDKLRSFRHFIRHGYDYELDVDELKILQKKINLNFEHFLENLDHFQEFLTKLSNSEPSDE